MHVMNAVRKNHAGLPWNIFFTEYKKKNNDALGPQGIKVNFAENI